MSEFIVEYLPDTTSIEREEIVRCRDCEHLVAHGTGCAYWDYCDIESIDGFCKWGERRGRESVEVWGQWSADDVTCSEES